MSQAGSITVTIASTLSNALDLGTASVPISYSKTISFADGTGAGQADLVWHDTRTVSDGGNEDIDVAGTLTALLGGTLTLARVKGVWVFSHSDNTTNLTITEDATAGISLFSAVSEGVAVLTPGNGFLYTNNSATGLAVTATTADIAFNIANGAGATADYDVVIFGASA